MSPKSRTVAIIAAVVVAVLLIVALRVFTGGGDNSGSQSAPNQASAADPEGKTCTRLNVMASSEKAALLSTLADKYNTSSRANDLAGECGRVDVQSKASGAALDALTNALWDERDGVQPDVWSPAATSWLRLLSVQRSEVDAPSISPDDAPSIANTPLVIAMPQPMAEALGWPEKDLGWSDILTLAQDPSGWGSVGHPEWGPFKLGKTNPNFSTSGLNATVGAYFAATGLSSDLSVEDATSPAALEYVEGIESSVVHYGDTTLTFLSNMMHAAEEGRGLSYVSAVTLEEKSVLDYNEGNPTGDPATLGEGEKPGVPLVSIYPKEGTLISDNPYAVLNADWVTSDAKKTAESFLGFVQEGEQQARFQEAGFRTFEGTPGDKATVENGIIAETPVTLSPPSPRVLDTVLSSWAEIRKGARVLLVVDTSGSMGGEKIELARQALLSSSEQFSDHDQVGLAEFSGGFQMLSPIQPFGESKSELTQVITTLNADGGTALYSATVQGLDEVMSLPSSDTIDAVVVLSDGENTERGDLTDVLAKFGNREENPVRLFTIGYGDGADQSVLKEMAQAGGGAAYNATDPASIEKVMTAVISNF